MMNCREATRLMSAACERPLTRRERWALKLHQCLCRGCRRFDRHLAFVRAAARHPDHSPTEENNDRHRRQL